MTISRGRLAAHVGRYYTLVDEGDVDAICRMFAANGCYQRPGHSLLLGTAAIRHFFEEERRIASGSHSLRRILTCGSTAIVEGDFEGVLKTGEAATACFVDLWDFDGDGLASRRRTYFDAPLV